MGRNFIENAIEEAIKFEELNSGGPFGAVIVKNNKIIARGRNLVTELNDPSAHAEIMAIRNACAVLKDFQLTGCEIYSSSEPCPMCFSAIYWARIEKVYFAANRQDAAKANFDDEFIYDELSIEPKKRKIIFEQVPVDTATLPFQKWQAFKNKIPY